MCNAGCRNRLITGQSCSNREIHCVTVQYCLIGCSNLTDNRVGPTGSHVCVWIGPSRIVGSAGDTRDGPVTTRVPSRA